MKNADAVDIARRRKPMDRLFSDDTLHYTYESGVNGWRIMAEKLADTMRENERLRGCISKLIDYPKMDDNDPMWLEIANIEKPNKDSSEPNCSGVHHANKYTGGIPPQLPQTEEEVNETKLDNHSTSKLY